MNASDPLALPGLPKDQGGPIFAEPWQAQAFALTVRLNAAGAFEWSDWAQTLSTELASDPDDDGSRYYLHWVSALETLMARRGLVSTSDLVQRKQAWADAYRHTPHGTPVALPGN